ncbi:MAG: efflux RND transporter permease subunit [Bacteriovoracia bacterium]
MWSRLNFLRSPLSVLAVFIGFLGLSFSQLKNLRTELQIYHLDDTRFKTAQDFQRVRKSFADPASFQLHWSKQNGPFTMVEVCQIEKLVRNLKKLTPIKGTFIASISSPLDLRTFELTGSRLWFPRLLSVQCQNPTTEPVDLTPLYNFPLYLQPLTTAAILSYNLKLATESDKAENAQPDIIGEAYVKALQLQKEIPGLELHIAGRGATPWHMQKMMMSDAPINLLVFLFILIFFRLFHGSWTSGFLLTGSLVTTLTISLGVMAYLDIPIDALTNTLFILVIISGVEDYIFLVEEKRKNPQTQVNQPFIKLRAPSFFTSLTTIIGFGVLVFSRIEIIQRFGAIAAFSALIEWFILLFALPALLTLFPALANKWLRIDKAWAPRWLDSLATLRPSFIVSVIMVAISLAGFLAFSHLKYNDSPRENFPIHHPAHKAYAFLTQQFGSEGSLEIVFPAKHAKPKNFEEKISSISGVVKIHSLPALFHAIPQDLPQEVTEDIKRHIMQTDLAQHYQNDEWERWVVYVQSIDQESLKKMIIQIQAICQDTCFPSGELVVYADFADEVASTLFKGLDLSLLLVGLTVIFLCWWRKIKPLWPVLFSLFWCPLMLLLVLVVFNVPINLMTCLIGAIFVGLSGDNSIQYLFASKNLEDGALERSRATVVLTILSMCLCGFLWGFTLRPLHTVGTLLAVGFAFILIGDLWVLRGLLHKANRGANTRTKDSIETN